MFSGRSRRRAQVPFVSSPNCSGLVMMLPPDFKPSSLESCIEQFVALGQNTGRAEATDRAREPSQRLLIRAFIGESSTMIRPPSDKHGGLPNGSAEGMNVMQRLGKEHSIEEAIAKVRPLPDVHEPEGRHAATISRRNPAPDLEICLSSGGRLIHPCRNRSQEGVCHPEVKAAMKIVGVLNLKSLIACCHGHHASKGGDWIF